MTQDSISVFADSITPLTLLAVLGQADTVTMMAFFNEPTYHHPEVCEQAGLFMLSPGLAASTLQTLEQAAPELYRQIHQKAIGHLGDRLRAGDVSVEPVFFTIFDRLGSQLLSADPEAFCLLVDQASDIPLNHIANQQLRCYFEAVALAKSEQYSAAISNLDALLADSSLSDDVKGRALNSRAIYCNITGRLEESMQGHRASIEHWQQQGNRHREGLSRLNLGIMTYGLRKYDDAEANLVEAERCFAETGARRWLASVQNELGLVHRDQGNWSQAITCFESAITQHRAQGAQDYLGSALTNLGEIYLFLGQLEQATEAFREALSAMATRVNMVDVYLSLGLTYQVMGDLSKAHLALQEGLNLAIEIERRDILALAHFRLGDVLRRMNDHTAALAEFEAAVTVIEATREPLQDEDLKISLLGRWQQVYEGLVLQCFHMNRPSEAFLWAERARARAFADALDEDDLSTPKKLRNQQVSNQNTRLPTFCEHVEAIQDVLGEDTALLSYFTTGVLEDDLPLLKALPADSPLRDHLLTPAETICFVLSSGKLSAHLCRLNPNAFSSSSQRHEDYDRYLQPPVLSHLYQTLFKPIDAISSAKALYIVPHGPLHRIPFAALVNDINQPVLQSDGPTMAYIPSATILRHHQAINARRQNAQTRRNKATKTHSLTIGFDGEAQGVTLRHTEAEAMFVADLIDGTAWIGPQSKRTQLCTAVRDQQFIHIACHGWFNHADPLESYLLIGEDERLTAQEILDTWHLQADLVTLSACQTGVSRILRGDEPMGMMRALLSVGAKAILATQWPVEDLPTFLLMRYFYETLLDTTMSPAMALHAAQRWLRDLSAVEVDALLTDVLIDQSYIDQAEWSSGIVAKDQPFMHPRYWAGFILVGAIDET